MKSIVAVVLLLACGLAAGEIKDKGWWKNAVFYQVYPRSFMDSDADGIGDLQGIRSKLQHFKDLGVTAIWLSPINKSPMKDFGYDISDFRDIDKTFGTLNDFRQLVDDAHKLGLKVVLDLVPNHTSDEHEWFKKSVNSIPPYKDYYIWANPKGNDTKPQPPNNWVSVFNGSAWTYNKERKQFYFHQFLPEQPDLNYRNKQTRDEMENIIKFWLNFGLDGFRIDAVPHLYEDEKLRDEPYTGTQVNKSLHANLVHTFTKDRPETYDLIQSWRKVVDDYANEMNRTEIVLLTEAYTYLNKTLEYYNHGSHVPFNFKFITDVNAESNAMAFKRVIDTWMNGMPKDGVSNWVMGNHDRVRVATRYPKRGDQMIMLEMILPGVAVTYYGEEIGMLDKEGLHLYDPTRDGCRTPFQWDNTTNAGFSEGNKTWLPVHESYKILNLMQEKKDPDSHYNMYVQLIKLRQRPVLANGTLQTVALNNDTVLLVKRSIINETATLLLNFDKNVAQLDLRKYITNKTKIAVGSVGSNLTKDTSVDVSVFKLPGLASVVLLSNGTIAASGASAAGFSIMTVLLLLVVSLFRP